MQIIGYSLQIVDNIGEFINQNKILRSNSSYPSPATPNLIEVKRLISLKFVVAKND